MHISIYWLLLYWLLGIFSVQIKNSFKAILSFILSCVASKRQEEYKHKNICIVLKTSVENIKHPE